ncbi:MAG: RNA 2',3'-cyclic phosphodiesterase [Bacillota bacterium]
MRYFIALDFDKQDRKRFHVLAKMLKAHSDKARIVEEDHIHLTLAFLGEINSEQVRQAKAVVNAIEAEAFTLEFDTVSYFEPRRGGRIFWIGPDANPALKRLHTHVRDALLGEGFALDERPFTPHVTLARGVHIHKEHAGDFKDAFETFVVPVPSVSLMVSTFKAGKLVYETLAKKPLKQHSR